jgi:hypothetical protein
MGNNQLSDELTEHKKATTHDVGNPNVAELSQYVLLFDGLRFVRLILLEINARHVLSFFTLWCL